MELHINTRSLDPARFGFSSLKHKAYVQGAALALIAYAFCIYGWSWIDLATSQKLQLLCPTFDDRQAFCFVRSLVSVLFVFLPALLMMYIPCVFIGSLHSQHTGFALLYIDLVGALLVFCFGVGIYALLLKGGSYNQLYLPSLISAVKRQGIFFVLGGIVFGLIYGKRLRSTNKD